MVNFLILVVIVVYLIIYLIRSVFFVAGLKKELSTFFRLLDMIPFAFFSSPLPAIYEHSPDRVIWMIRISYFIFLVFDTVLIILLLK
jgi:hypothetical protein